MIGKKVNGNLYIYYTYASKLSTDYQNMLKKAEPFIESKGYLYNVIRLSIKKNTISFLDYEHFNTVNHPVLLRSINVNLNTNTIKVIDFSKRRNKPILHRKELLVDSSYSLYEHFVNITKDEEAAGYYTNTKVIGTEKGWGTVTNK